MQIYCPNIVQMLGVLTESIDIVSFKGKPFMDICNMTYTLFIQIWLQWIEPAS